MKNCRYRLGPLKKHIFNARHGIFVALALYSIGIFIGWTWPELFPFFKDFAQRSAASFQDLNAVAYVVKILTFNLFATYLTMCTISFFGVVPATASILNGLLLGWVIVTAYRTAGYNVTGILIPHGVFEWPAMLIAWGFGIWRGVGYRSNNPHLKHFHRWVIANKIFLSIVMPLLLVAAIVESRALILKG